MKRKINFIAIHCTATAQSATPEAIIRYWKENRKWKSPGYHILIDKDGKKHYLQPFDLPANGVKGFNSSSIHISYIGGVDAKQKGLDNRTPLQKASILEAIKEALDYSGGKPTIQGHRDFPNVAKECPSFNAKLEYQNL